MEKIVLQQAQDNPEPAERIGIVTEEAVDLPREIIEKYQIAIVPVKLFWPEIENLPGENTFQKMRELEKRGTKSFGKTSQPSLKDFLDKYNYQLERFDKVICITLTSKLSGSNNSAVQAKKFLEPGKQEKVFVLDSLSASSGQALVVLKAIELIESKKEINEIVKELEEFIPKVRCYVMFEDPKWVEASGRISHLVATLMRELGKRGIRPVMTFKEGVLKPTGLKAGAKDIPTALFKQFGTDTEKLRKEEKKIRIAITHGDDLEGARRLKEMIEKEPKNVEVAFLNILDNIIGALAGPNAITLSWCQI